MGAHRSTHNKRKKIKRRIKNERTRAASAEPKGQAPRS